MVSEVIYLIVILSNCGLSCSFYRHSAYLLFCDLDILILKVILQDMIENVLEIKDTHVREVMTPLVDVVAIDASATLIDFHNLWVTHQYSR